MRIILVSLSILAAGCAPSGLLAVDDTRPGVTGARATGQFPDIQAVPPRAARQLDAEDYADIAAELNAEADAAARLPRVDGAAGDRSARATVAQAERAEERRRRRIRNQGRVAPAS